MNQRECRFTPSFPRRRESSVFHIGALFAAWSLLVCLASFAFSPLAHAQLSAGLLLRLATQAKDLDFPTEPSPLTASSTPGMALYKPDGPGPFPAIVLMHQCGGLRNPKGRWQNQSMLDWAREAVSRGYVALLVDSLGPRGVDSVCMGGKNGVTFHRGVRDALQAAEHLRKQPYVDAKRVAMAGYSWGAMAGVLASSKLWGESLNGGQRFDAVVSLYPGCFRIQPPGGTPYEIMNNDIDRPLLVLMGGQDTETPASGCIPKLEQLKAAGAPVEWNLYPDATHCWDCKNLNGNRKTDVRGNSVLYTYDEKVTADSGRRLFEFVERAFGAKGK
jgi:dienelactone hydrolase